MVFATSAVGLGCASGGLPPSDARIEGSRCFAAPQSLVFPLGDTSARADSSGAWLILTSRPVSGTNDTIRQALSYDIYGNQQGGVWWKTRDTIIIETNDPFTTNSLRLQVVQSGLKGQGSGTTDQFVRNDSSGVYEPIGETWPAVFLEVSCRALPRPRREGAMLPNKRLKLAARVD
jgi:hypothetical protein